MKTVYIDLHEIKDVYPAASACIGYFDGVHKGHQKLMERTLIAAQAKKLSAACITFDPDPWVWTIPWRRALQSSAVFLPEESHAWWAPVPRVAKSQIWLK